MKRFKPFTPSIDKKSKWYDYRENRMRTYAKINWKSVYLKEKYGRVDASVENWGTHLFMETMLDYETMSEGHCMYCNANAKQYWTHEDSWVIHLCLPCLIGDKVTILLERIIRRWRKRNDKSDWYTSFTRSG